MLQKRQVNNSTPDIANELVWLKEISKGLQNKVVKKH